MASPAPPPEESVSAADTLLALALVRASDGDAEAFAEVYRLMHAPIRRVAGLILQDEHLAEEVAQEVLIEVWQYARRFEPRTGQARSWIMTIARRRSIDRVRAVEAARRRDQDELDARHLLAEHHDVADLVARRWMEQRVRAQLTVLTQLQKQALVLAFYGNHSYSSVARVLGIPVATAKSRVRDALLRLARELEGLDEE
ncbi:sigma-70 family RNA polymerase sigma factor [Motilibacter rhizosphaerae]|nr:sigma-70 family RNA polymerase sigma factor [Motilibacter rhizosphaerae]